MKSYLVLLILSAMFFSFPAVYGQIENPNHVQQSWDTDTTRSDIPLSDLKTLLKRNQIPPVENPEYVAVDELSHIYVMQEPVIAVLIGGEARAYPVNMLSYHEIVNDRIGVHSFAVTYCPLCNSAIVFNRLLTFNGEDYELTFGTSGMLRKSNLVMWDEETESWWQQFTGKAIVGDLTGAELDILPSQMISLSDFAGNYPEGKVLSHQTGKRSLMTKYDKNPYPHYDDLSNTNPRLFEGPVDDRLPAMARVINLSHEATNRAYPLKTIRKEKVINDEIAGKPVVLFYADNMLSNLDEKKLAESKQIGAAVAYHAKVGDQKLTFKPDDDGFKDLQTGSIWNLAGKCVDGKFKGKQLKAEESGHHFAFAYFAFFPEAEVYK